MVTLTLNNDQGEDIASLYRWLLDDPDLRRTASITLAESNPEAGTMGAAFDVINLTITSGFSAASLAVAFATWKDAHRKITGLVLRNGKREAIIETASEEEVENLVRVLSDDQ